MLFSKKPEKFCFYLSSKFHNLTNELNLMEKPTLKSIWVISILFLLLSIPPKISQTTEDLFSKRDPDSAIKMIRFPQSMAVVQSRPGAGKYYTNNSIKFSHLKENELDRILSDPKALKQTLRKVDPTRIAPVTFQEDLFGNLTREMLNSAGEKYKVDILLVFRRTINKLTSSSLTFQTQGLIYLVKQKKVIPLSSSKKNVPYSSADQFQYLKQSNKESLRTLTENARKSILSYKFEKRRSAY